MFLDLLVLSWLFRFLNFLLFWCFHFWGKRYRLVLEVEDRVVVRDENGTKFDVFRKLFGLGDTDEALFLVGV